MLLDQLLSMAVAVAGHATVTRPLQLEYRRPVRPAVVAVSTQAVRRYAKRDMLSAVPKAGVEALVKAVAVEEGRYGVRANGIEVGMLRGRGCLDLGVPGTEVVDAVGWWMPAERGVGSVMVVAVQPGR
jgi:3-oxoacyl-[acyl-carrier protein] reductase